MPNSGHEHKRTPGRSLPQGEIRCNPVTASHAYHHQGTKPAVQRRPTKPPGGKQPRGTFLLDIKNQANTRYLSPPTTHHHTENMNLNTQSPNPTFYHPGRIIAVLELGARAQTEVRWFHLYYALGFIPWAGLREPPHKHQQSALERKGTGDRYRESLDLLANQLQQDAGLPTPLETLAAWVSTIFSYQADKPPTGIPTRSLPQDAPTYAQGCLDQRRPLQPDRPTATPQGRHPRLPSGLPPGPDNAVERRRQRPTPLGRLPVESGRPAGPPAKTQPG